MAEIWASTGAVWRDMLLAEALVFFFSVFQGRFNNNNNNNNNNSSVSLTIVTVAFLLTLVGFTALFAKEPRADQLDTMLSTT